MSLHVTLFSNRKLLFLCQIRRPRMPRFLPASNLLIHCSSAMSRSGYKRSQPSKKKPRITEHKSGENLLKPQKRENASSMIKSFPLSSWLTETAVISRLHLASPLTPTTGRKKSEIGKRRKTVGVIYFY